METTPPCTLLIHSNKTISPSTPNEIKSDLESSNIPTKIAAMKRAITLLLNGETLPHLFITVVRHVLPSDDHAIQKLLLLYLETVHTRDAAWGKIFPEMILLVDFLGRNLRHPNEYVRAATLRFVRRRLDEPKMVEPLVDSVLSCLRHRRRFVRRHALAAIAAVYYRLLRHDGDGDGIIRLLPHIGGGGGPARRNAFLAARACSPERAVAYLLANADRVVDWPDHLQMAAVEAICKVFDRSPAPANSGGEGGRYIEIVVAECGGGDSGGAVVFMASPTDANTYCQLLSASQSDDGDGDSVEVIVLERLHELRCSQSDVMMDMVMDVLSALSSPSVHLLDKA
uniref:Clathrin/coatomer adaptor adaptin-like N-terminal domain-containing protein n=1 Tax=Leersia perrieri TaxID=77586 RepID=A0A0D9XPK2_9ORYZ